ncbi:MAG TPA: cytochrome P450 [Acidimicrobiales bacterium]|nr:cytochrome P450 [Acidimicrobiales bacterium]
MPAPVPVDDLDLAVFDRHEPGLRGERLHDALDRLASRHWMARADLGVVVLEREAVVALLRDRRLSFPAAELLGLQGVEGAVQEAERNGLMGLSGEAHSRLRRALSAAMATRNVGDVRPLVHSVLEASWGAVRAGGSCEAVGALAEPVPSAVVAWLLGLAAGAAPTVARWSSVLQSVFKLGAANDWAEVERCQREVSELVGSLLDGAQGAEASKFVQVLALSADGEASGHDQGRAGSLSRKEAANLVIAILAGGVDTTRAQIAHGLRLFAEHPDQWHILRCRPELASRAATEVLRYEPITPFTARVAREDVEYRNVIFPAGTVIFCCLATANRDPSIWAEPGRFDISRAQPVQSVLSFGAGSHFCAGAQLAHMELEQVLGFLASRAATLHLEAPPVYGNFEGIYELVELRLGFAPAAATS